MSQEIALGNRVKYRSQNEIEEQKRGKLGNFANTWLLNDEVTGILKVPCTPDSKLLNIANENASFETEILQGGIRYNLERFILEALEIEQVKNTPDVHIMNSRSGWGG